MRKMFVAAFCFLSPFSKVQNMITPNNFLFPEPTGQHAVGTTFYYFKDENRRETHSDNAADKRELMIQVWYPAKGAKHVSPIPYPAEPCAEMLHIERAIPYDELEDLKTIRTYASPNILPENNQKYPVILFSPGFCCPRTNNTANCEELASHGYIVVGIDPTYAASMVQFPDGRVIKHQDIQILEQDIDDREQQFWVDDMKFILDQLVILNHATASPFYCMVDLDKIGIFGHSYGGSTAAQLCRLDKRCKAGISFDGGLFGENPIEGFDKPFMFILAEEWPWANQTAEQVNVTQMQYVSIKRKWLEYIPALCAAIGKETYQLKIKNTKHNDFSDAALIKEMPSFKSFQLDVGTINGFRLTEIVNAYIVHFFDKYLKGKSSELLDGNFNKYDEVEKS